ncbi:MAG: DUF4340 domain-containing protein [Acidobacteria bacterium]|nr:DUF4340 domain-containing protein [Acidobacteriota bacterium]
MKRSTLILLIFAAVLGTVVYYLEYKPGKPRDEGTEAPSSKPAWEVKSDDIASVQIRKGEESIRLTADGDKWMLSEPLTDRAGESAVRSLLSDLAGLTIEREFTPRSSDDLSSYGLANPALRIEMKTKNGASHVVEIGEKDVIGAAAYARLDGGQSVVMISPALLTSAGRKVNEFRDRTLLGGTSTDLAGLKFVGPSGVFEIARKDDVWSFISPAPGQTEDSEVSSLISSLTTAEAVDIVSETQAEAGKYGLASPRLSLTVRLNGGGERTIAIGDKTDDDYFAKMSDRPQVYKVNASFRDRVATSSSVLRSKSMVSFNRDELKSIRIRNASLTLLAERNSEGKWLIGSPDDLKGLEASSFFILDPFETRAIEVIEKPDSKVVAALSKPLVEAQITNIAGQVTLIRFSVPRDNTAYARVEGRTEIFKVPESVVNTLGFKADQVAISPTPGKP